MILWWFGDVGGDDGGDLVVIWLWFVDGLVMLGDVGGDVGGDLVLI